MKYFKYIAILFVCIAVSCTTEDLGKTIYKKNQVQFVGRIMSFAERNVGSRAIAKTEPESEVKTMNLIVFGNDNSCVYMSETSDEMVFNIDRGVKDENGNVISGDFIDIDQANLSKCHIYTITNFPELATSGLGVGSPASAFMNLKTQVKGIDIPETGIPMLGICDAEVNLQAGGDAITTPYEVRMHALYSKMVFNITVDADQELPKTPFFTLTDVKVNNVVGSVDFKGKITDPVNNKESESGKNNGTNDTYDEEVSEYSCFFDVDNAVAEDGGNSASFYFYLPERYLRANIAADDYSYPFNRPEDMDYRQRFKPELATEDATYVTFTGVYTDHQGHEYKVSYNIYVGNDNYGNFDVVANTQYNNSILIRGLANSDDQVNVGDGENDPISIDHRVDVERVNPIIINFRRETLLDSHFEVRPLRVHKREGYVGDVKVKVEVLNAKTPNATTDANRPNWIRIEHKNDASGTYASDYLSNGKRKYFTTGLVSGVNNETNNLSASHTIPNINVSSSKQCVWIYVDEADYTQAKDDVRSSVVRVSYSVDGGKSYINPVDYVINQRELFPVTFTNGTPAENDDYSYLIEYHEEYLYNYDAEDEYGQTEQKGMKWGLEGKQLSEKYATKSLFGGDFQAITNWIENRLSTLFPYYDFYLKGDTDNADATIWDHDGWTFCNNIINTINGVPFNNKTLNSDESDNITQLTLDEDPKSAIEYCYNKNKRDRSGNVVYNNDAGWYLPAIDEMEDIVMSQYQSEGKMYYVYTRFTDLRDNLYWSSQPAFYQQFMHVNRDLAGPGDRGAFYNIDNKDYARATSVKFLGGNPDDPNNYTSEESIPNGYYQYIYVDYNNNQTITEYEVEEEQTITVDWGSWFNLESQKVTLTPMDPALGYYSRSEKARVRCVRKIPTN